MPSPAAQDADLYKLTGLCSAIAASCVTLSYQLTHGPAAGLCDKRLAYQSAVRLAETEERFDHRSAYSRLFNITVAGATPRQTAFDGGASQRAADAYRALLAKPIITRQSAARYERSASPALDVVNAYTKNAADSILEASAAALRPLLTHGWLPSPAPPLAWTAPIHADTHKTTLAGLGRLLDALREAQLLVDAVGAFLAAATTLTETYRHGSAVKMLLPVLAGQPVVTQGSVVASGLMSDVAFQKGIKTLEGLGICVELTMRQKHRAWASANTSLLQKFEGFEFKDLEAEQPTSNEAKKLSLEIEGEPSALNDVEDALSKLEQILDRGVTPAV